MAIKVLVVDNSNKTCNLARSVLSPLGCEVITATSVALGIFLARKNFPSLILSDLTATEDHQFELIAEVKADPDLRHIPLILFGNQSDPAAKAQALALGAEKLLVHPIKPGHFIEELRPYLSENEDARATESPE